MSILPKPSSDSSVRPGWDSSKMVAAELAVVAKLAVVATACWGPNWESEMVVAELEEAANPAKMKAILAKNFIVYYFVGFSWMGLSFCKLGFMRT